LVAVMAIMLIISAAILTLLNGTQGRFRSEQVRLDALQSARIGLDEVTRDIHRAGYPPQNSFIPGVPTTSYAIPFVGLVSGAINQNCTVNGGGTPCDVPDDLELAIETLDGSSVSWIYYQLKLPVAGSSTCTLYRNETTKSLAGAPSATGGTPLVENVINKSNGTCDVSGGTGTALFTYVCAGGSPCNPQNISQINIQLQVIPTVPDAQTHQYAAITLQGVAWRMNPPR
jgi:type II secretory pathway pseudopilin PulG